jgi:hypothetical protein
MPQLEGTDFTFSKADSTGISAQGRPVAKTRILVLEEHPLLRDGMTDFLNAQLDLQVCGEAGNIRDARNEITKCKPQLLVTALRLGTGDSLEFVKALKAEKPGLLILVYSAFEEAIFSFGPGRDARSTGHARCLCYIRLCQAPQRTPAVFGLCRGGCFKRLSGAHCNEHRYRGRFRNIGVRRNCGVGSAVPSG